MFNINTEIEYQQYINQMENLRNYWENKMRIKAEKILQSEKNRVLKAIIQTKKIEEKNDYTTTITSSEWESFYREIYIDVTNDFGEITIEDYEENITELEYENDWLNQAILYSIPIAVERIKDVTTTSRDRLREVIDQNILNNGTVKELILAINELYEHDIPIRSKNISTTEVITAGNIGMRFAVKSLGIIVKKKWVAIMDERTRLSHWNTNGEMKSIDELYSNGLMFPGDPAAPAEEVINCRCIESFII